MSDTSAKTTAQEALRILEEAYAYYMPPEHTPKAKPEETAYFEYLDAA